MEIGRQFNTLTLQEYFFYIDNYKKYSDFNTLGLYRSISENDALNLAEKIELRAYCHKTFKKSFDFLQIKDPWTFIRVSTLGEELTAGDKQKLWDDIHTNQELIIKNKKFGHRNFGEYSKHNCGYETCPYNGIMIRQGSPLEEWNICIGYTNRYVQKLKSDRRKTERKTQHQIIKKDLDLE